MNFYLVDSTKRRKSFDTGFQRVTEIHIHWSQLSSNDIIFAHSTDFREDQSAPDFDPEINPNLLTGSITKELAINRITQLRLELCGLPMKEKPWFILYSGDAVSDADYDRKSLSENAIPDYPPEKVFVIQIPSNANAEQIKFIVDGIVEAISQNGADAVTHHESSARAQESIVALRILCEVWLLKNRNLADGYKDAEFAEIPGFEKNAPILPDEIGIHAPSAKEKWLNPFDCEGDALANQMPTADTQAAVKTFFEEINNQVPEFSQVADLFLILSKSLALPETKL